MPDWRLTQDFQRGTRFFAAGAILDSAAEDIPQLLDDGMPLEAVATGTTMPFFVDDTLGFDVRAGFPSPGHRVLTQYATLGALIDALPRMVNEPLAISVAGAPYAYSFAGHFLVQGATVTWGDGTVQVVAAGAGVISPAILDVTHTCEAAVSVRDLVWLDGTTARRARANAEATMPAIGFVVSKSNATTCTVRDQGVLGGFAGLTAGETQYVSDAAAGARIEGAAAIAQLDDPGDVVQAVGKAISATEIEIDIDVDDIVVQA